MTEKQEPFAWFHYSDFDLIFHDVWEELCEGQDNWVPLYTQPKREWQGLTDAEIAELHHEIKVRLMGTYKTEDIYRAIEAKLKEKNDA